MNSAQGAGENKVVNIERIRLKFVALALSSMSDRDGSGRQPVISVDTKKKELVCDFKIGGREWRHAGKPEEVRVHDFQDKELGKAIPYGFYDVTNNQG